LFACSHFNCSFVPDAGLAQEALPRDIIQTGREIFGTHKLSSWTYARALKVLGESNLVDIVDLMGDYAGTGARLTAVNQQMPAGWKQFLPLPFTPPDDIYPDLRSRLPLLTQNQTQSAAPRAQTAAAIPRPQNAPPPPALYSLSRQVLAAVL
jgi:hypothetical protein